MQDFASFNQRSTFCTCECILKGFKIQICMQFCRFHRFRKCLVILPTSIRLASLRPFPNAFCIPKFLVLPELCTVSELPNVRWFVVRSKPHPFQPVPPQFQHVVTKTTTPTHATKPTFNFYIFESDSTLF